MSGWANSKRPGSTRQSRTMRDRVLREEPTCRVEGCEQPSVEDDHIVPWSQREAHGMTISDWHRRSNHQGLCAGHHAIKTRGESLAARPQARAKRRPRRHPGEGPPAPGSAGHRSA